MKTNRRKFFTGLIGAAVSAPAIAKAAAKPKKAIKTAQTGSREDLSDFLTVARHERWVQEGRTDYQAGDKMYKDGCVYILHENGVWIQMTTGAKGD